MITPQQIIPFADRLQKVLFGYLRLFSVTYPQANIHKYIHSLYRIVLTDLIHIKLLTSMAHINIQTSPCSPTYISNYVLSLLICPIGTHQTKLKYYQIHSSIPSLS